VSGTSGHWQGARVKTTRTRAYLGAELN